MSDEVPNYEHLFGGKWKAVCGDTYLVKNFVSECGWDPDDLLAEVRGMDYVARDFPGIMYRGNELNREKFFLYDRLTCPVGIPWYGYPGGTYVNAITNTLPMTEERCPLNLRLLREIQALPGAEATNHCIGTGYTKPNDNIGAHSDKKQDMKPGAPIFIISLGNNRPLVMRHKETEEVVTLYPEHGDAVILGWGTNLEWTHEVPVKERPKGLSDEEWAATIDPRYSLVFRTISTILSPEVQEKKLRETAASKVKRQEAKARKLEPESKRVCL